MLSTPSGNNDLSSANTVHAPGESSYFVRLSISELRCHRIAALYRQHHHKMYAYLFASSAKSIIIMASYEQIAVIHKHQITRNKFEIPTE